MVPHGYLGYMADGELVICGRLKDIIIVADEISHLKKSSGR